jgi:putative FmdB family regulatory protein
MPTYEYECRECGYRFEAFHSIKGEPIKKCPKCHKDKVRRLISAGAGIIFKGSGFYATDYKRSHTGGKKEAKCDKAGSKPACASCEGGKPKDD